MTPQTLTVPSRFNGPPGSGNGGYTCGLVAEALGSREAEVSLRSPPPLDTPLEVSPDGEGVVVRAGETVVAQGGPARVEVEAPSPVSIERAAAAAASGYRRWITAHPFPTCVVCGPERGEGDGMCIFPGPLGDGRFAATWTPHEAFAGTDGTVPPECVWAALDCPTCAPVANFGQGPPIVLARLAAAIDGDVGVGERYALLAWELGRDGRKRESACALLDGSGQAIARSRALWIELREE